MKEIALAIASVIAMTVCAHADDRLDARIKLMKLAYACDGTGVIRYKTARDAALRAEQMASTNTMKTVVLGIDRDLRDGAIKEDVDKSKCSDLVDRMTFEMKAQGFL